MATALGDIDRLLPRLPILQPSFPWIIFDLDGTLVDSFELIVASFNFAAGRFLQRKLSSEQVMNIPGRTLEDQLANYVPENAVPIMVERYHKFFARHFNPRSSIFPGIRNLLFNLQRRGIKLALYTGACKRTTETVLIQSGLSRFFTTLVTCEDIIAPKPDPEGLRIAIKAIGADSNRTVYIGDHPNDIKASRSAGAKTGAAFWGQTHRNELMELKPDFVFRHPSEALRLSAYHVSFVNDDARISRPSLLGSIAVQQAR
jgi:pyrophosphatase PpaX